LFFLLKKEKEQDMKEQIFPTPPSRLTWNHLQDLPVNAEHNFRVDHPKSSLPPLYSQPIKSVAARKEHQRRLAFARIIDKFSGQDIPGKDYVIRYLQHKFRRNCKKNSLINMDISLRFFLMGLQTKGRVLEDISREDIEAFIEHEQDRGLSMGYVHSRLKMVYSFIGYLAEKNVVNGDILTRRIRIKLPVSLPRAIDPEDLKILFSVMKDTRDRAIFLMLLRTGMRIGELLDLQVADMYLPEKKILIYEGEKNARGRVVYFSDDAEQALRAWLGERDPQEEMLFYGYKTTLSYGTAYLRFRKCLEAAGLSHKGYTIHCLRHTYASELLNAGLRLEVLQQLLGHSSLEVTRQYARLTDRTRETEYFCAMTVIERGEIDGHY
jgi:site-specific recombinase XerD